MPVNPGYLSPTKDAPSSPRRRHLSTGACWAAALAAAEWASASLARFGMQPFHFLHTHLYLQMSRRTERTYGLRSTCIAYKYLTCKSHKHPVFTWTVCCCLFASYSSEYSVLWSALVVCRSFPSRLCEWLRASEWWRIGCLVCVCVAPASPVSVFCHGRQMLTKTAGGHNMRTYCVADGHRRRLQMLLSFARKSAGLTSLASAGPCRQQALDLSLQLSWPFVCTTDRPGPCPLRTAFYVYSKL